MVSGEKLACSRDDAPHKDEVRSKYRRSPDIEKEPRSSIQIDRDDWIKKNGNKAERGRPRARNFPLSHGNECRRSANNNSREGVKSVGKSRGGSKQQRDRDEP
jgi:hypothetical protein